MEMKQELLNKTILESLEGSSFVYVLESGEIFSNHDHDGIESSGSLDKPYLRFDLQKVGNYIQEGAAENFKTQQEREVQIKSDQATISDHIHDAVKKWDQATTVHYFWHSQDWELRNEADIIAEKEQARHN